MKKILIIVSICILACAVLGFHDRCSPNIVQDAADGTQSLEAAVQNQESNVQIEGEGAVITLLPDDTKGSRHQRILLRLAGGGTLLLAHNIDLAPRVEGLEEGDVIH